MKSGMKGFNLVKQAQQLQQKITKIQEEIGKKTITAAAGGGMVEVMVNGKQEVLSIKIDPEVVSSDDLEMLQDMLVAAVNKGLSDAKQMMTDALAGIAGGMQIPNLF